MSQQPECVQTPNPTSGRGLEIETKEWSTSNFNTTNYCCTTVTSKT